MQVWVVVCALGSRDRGSAWGRVAQHAYIGPSRWPRHRVLYTHPRLTPSIPPFPSPPSAGAGLARARRHTAIFQPLPRLVVRWCSDLGFGRGRWDGASIISNHPRRPSAFNWKLHRAYAPDAPPRLPPEIQSPVVTTLAGIAPPKHIKSVKEKTCIIQ